MSKSKGRFQLTMITIVRQRVQSTLYYCGVMLRIDSPWLSIVGLDGLNPV
jgi:hypothetical protein